MRGPRTRPGRPPVLRHAFPLSAEAPERNRTENSRELLHEGPDFVQRVVETPAFREMGVACGRTSSWRWAVVDPCLHPLYVWAQRGDNPFAYAQSALRLGSAVFTNGPMMGKVVSGVNVTRARAGLEVAIGTVCGGLAGGLGSRGIRRRLFASALGGAVGMSSAAIHVLSGWVPCGYVISRRNHIEDIQDFNGEGKYHTWFGRFDLDYDSYRVGTGAPPTELYEGVGGLISIVRGFRMPDRSPSDPAFDADFAALADKQGVAAWALIDLPHRRSAGSTGRVRAGGVLFVLGSRERTAADAGVALAALGARDAVATDQRGSVMLGAGRYLAIAPPPHRQLIQHYGLCCI